MSEIDISNKLRRVQKVIMVCIYCVENKGRRITF